MPELPPVEILVRLVQEVLYHDGAWRLCCARWRCKYAGRRFVYSRELHHKQRLHEGVESRAPSVMLLLHGQTICIGELRGFAVTLQRWGCERVCGTMEEDVAESAALHCGALRGFADFPLQGRGSVPVRRRPFPGKRITFRGSTDNAAYTALGVTASVAIGASVTCFRQRT